MMGNCCDCGQGTTGNCRLSATAFKQWRGWYPFGQDPATELVTTKYLKRVSYYEIDSKVVSQCGIWSDWGNTATYVRYDDIWVEITEQFNRWATNSGQCNGPLSLGSFDYVKIRDGSGVFTSPVVYECTSTPCGAPDEDECCADCDPDWGTEPYNYLKCLKPDPVDIDPSFDWCTTCRGGTPDTCTGYNAYATTVYGFATIFTAEHITSQAITEDGKVLTIEYDNGSETGRAIYTLSEPYTVDQLLADAETLLGYVSLTNYVKEYLTDCLATLRIGCDDGETMDVSITELNLCCGDPAASVQAFSIEPAANPGDPLRTWNGTGATVCKSRVTGPGTNRYCTALAAITKATTDDETYGSEACEEDGLTPPFERGPEDISGLGTLLFHLSSESICDEC